MICRLFRASPTFGYNSSRSTDRCRGPSIACGVQNWGGWYMANRVSKAHHKQLRIQNRNPSRKTQKESDRCWLKISINNAIYCVSQNRKTCSASRMPPAEVFIARRRSGFQHAVEHFAGVARQVRAGRDALHLCAHQRLAAGIIAFV